MKNEKIFWQVCNNSPRRGVYTVPAGNTNPEPAAYFVKIKESYT